MWIALTDNTLEKKNKHRFGVWKGIGGGYEKIQNKVEQPTTMIT